MNVKSETYIQNVPDLLSVLSTSFNSQFNQTWNDSLFLNELVIFHVIHRDNYYFCRNNRFYISLRNMILLSTYSVLRINLIESFDIKD